MNILFLDIDGVLNSIDYMMPRRNYDSSICDESTNDIRYNEHNVGSLMLDSRCVRRLGKIMDSCDIRIVLSSYWRISPWKVSYIRKIFEEYNMDNEKIIDKTPRLSNSNRTREILKWVDEHSHEVNRWIAVDDNVLELETENFVKTDSFLGLTDSDVNQIIRKFNT